MNSETFSQNKKEKNTQIQLWFADTLSEKFQQIGLKFATLFYPFLFCFLVKKFLLKNFIVLSFRIRIRARKLQNLLFELPV